MVNPWKVNDLVRDLKKYLADLESFFPVNEENLKKDLKLQYSVAFLIEQIVNECINLGNHILSSLNLETPTTFSEIFENLAKASLISDTTSEGMKGFVRIRNLIAHRYGKFTIEDLVEATHELETIKVFLDELLKNLRKKL